MSRVTVMLDDKLERQIRNIQANQILKTGESYSFSEALNDTIRRGLK